MTAEECIDRITGVISRPIAVADKPVFHVDGSSTNIIYPGGKDTLCRIEEIALTINEYKKSLSNAGPRYEVKLFADGFLCSAGVYNDLNEAREIKASISTKYNPYIKELK